MGYTVSMLDGVLLNTSFWTATSFIQHPSAKILEIPLRAHGLRRFFRVSMTCGDTFSCCDMEGNRCKPSAEVLYLPFCSKDFVPVFVSWCDSHLYTVTATFMPKKITRRI